MSLPIILAVDDSADDLLLAEIALRRINRPFSFIALRSGNKAISYLAGCGAFKDRARYPFPDILLVDLYMPDPNGLRVLSWVRARHFPRLVVAAFSGSPRPGDKERALCLGADCYISKDPATLQQAFHSLLLNYDLARSSAGPAGPPPPTPGFPNSAAAR